ncbi:MAG TPA: carbonic anhydrase [Alphaproteobacteria bacterium]
MAVPPNTIKALDHICNCGMDHSGARRHFLRTATAAAALAGIAASAAAVIAPRRALAQAPLTPDAALKELMDGNQRYIQERMTAPQHDLEILHAKAAEKQEPFAAVLSCADSRVPVELLFDQTIGHLFVCRVAGNVSTPEIIASLEYGAAVLGTKVIMVLGHGSCGAVKATIDGKPVPGQISALYASIRPAVNQAGPDLEAAIKANAKYHAGLLREASPVIAGLAKENKIKVVAGYYELGTGKVSLLS